MHAGSEVGFFMLGLPLVAAALLPAIWIEALVYQPILGLRFRPAIKLATWANLTSTLWCVGFGVGADVLLLALTGAGGPAPTRAAMLATLLPFLILSWRVERASVARRLPEAPARKVAVATAAANGVTYALMALGVALLGPATQIASARTAVKTAILSATPLRAEVNAHWRATRTFPAPRAPVAPFSNAPASVALGARGRIVIVVDAPHLAGIHGKRIELVPTVVEDDGRQAALQWRCRADAIASRDLPLNCRQAATAAP